MHVLCIRFWYTHFPQVIICSNFRQNCEILDGGFSMKRSNVVLLVLSWSNWSFDSKIAFIYVGVDMKLPIFRLHSCWYVCFYWHANVYESDIYIRGPVLVLWRKILFLKQIKLKISQQNLVFDLEIYFNHGLLRSKV